VAAIADAADRVDERDPGTVAEMPAQEADVHVDDVRRPLVGPVPDVPDDLGPGQHVIDPPGQQLEERELSGRQCHGPTIDAHEMAGGVDLERADAKDGRPLTAAASNQRTDPGGELGEREWLDEIVVRTDVQSPDSVVDRDPCREHEDRRPATGRPEVGADVEAVTVGQADVQDDPVVVVLRRQPTAVLGRRRRIDGITLRPQSPLEEVGESIVVFHDEQAHGVRFLGDGSVDGSLDPPGCVAMSGG
jgi:hypothetical protein